MRPLLSAIRRRWVEGLLLAALLTGLLSMAFSVREVGEAFGGFLMAWRPPAKWVIDLGTPPWWPGFQQGGLQAQDVLLTLDGAPIDANYPQVFSLALANGRPALPVEVLRGGEKVAAAVPVIRYTGAHMLEARLPEFINGSLIWLIALLIYSVRPSESLNRSAAAAAALFSLNQWLWHASLVAGRFVGLDVLNGVWMVCAPFLGPVLLNFAFRFVQSDPSAPLPHWQSALLRVVLIAAALIMPPYALVRLVYLPVLGEWQAPIRELLYRVVIIEQFAGAASIVIMLSIALFRRQVRSAARIRQQWLMLLLGFAIASPALAYHLVALLKDTGTFFVLGGLDLRYLYLAIPVAISLAVLRYQTFRSDLPLLIAVVALAGSAIAASLGDWLVRLTAGPAASFQLPPFLVIFGILSAAALASQLMRLRGIPRLFRWEATSYGAARRFGQRMSSEADLAELPPGITAALVRDLNLERAALWLWDPRAESFVLASDRTHADLAAAPPAPASLTPPNPAPDQRPLPVGRDAADMPLWLAPLREAGFEAAAPLITLHAPVGLLAFGKRWDEEIFHQRDLDIIELIAQHSASLITAAQQVSEIQKIPQRIAEAQEGERLKIAQELHDTVQQFLGRLPFQLEASRELLVKDPGRASDRLNRIVDDVQQAAKTVREIRANLAPMQLERGLIAPLRDLAARFEDRAGRRIAVNFDIDGSAGAALDTALAVPARHALYRVVQQALDNIEAHAQASAVTISLSHDREQGRVVLCIRDDGVGFDAGRRATAEADGHFGLRSMQARLAAIGGGLTVISTPGAGTRIDGWARL